MAIDHPLPGDYVLRVINYQSVASTYTLTASAFREGVTKIHPALAPYETPAGIRMPAAAWIVTTRA